jgi:LemA protein
MILSVFFYGLLLCGLYLSLIYNGLISVMQRVQRAWSLVEIQLQRRFDLIPRLVECTKTYMKHEADVQVGAAQGRTTGKSLIPSAESVNEQASATDAQTASIGKMVAIAEGYPDLRANDMFLKVSDELVDTEDRISLSREFFNDSVTAYNNRIQKLPDVIFAIAFKYQPAQLYQIQDFERALVEVDLGDDKGSQTDPGKNEQGSD